MVKVTNTANCIRDSTGEEKRRIRVAGHAKDIIALYANGRGKGVSDLAKLYGVTRPPILSLLKKFGLFIPQVGGYRPTGGKKSTPKTTKACLGCGHKFESMGQHNRLCRSCAERASAVEGVF